MSGQRYAERSEVSLQKTQSEITALLDKWGCRKVGLLSDRDAETVEIQFFWEGKRGKFAASFKISVARDPAQLHRTEKIQREYVQGRFRTLFYWLRSCLDAVDAGVIEPEQVFMPWLVTADGRTLGERIFELEDACGQRLLTQAAGS